MQDFRDWFDEEYCRKIERKPIPFRTDKERKILGVAVISSILCIALAFTVAILLIL